MDRMDDVGRNIDAHLKSAWGRTFLCTVQEVREGITVALMGIRKHMQKKEPMPFSEMSYQRKRCKDVHESLRHLIARGDTKHARRLRRILRSYERRLDRLLKEDQLARENKSVIAESADATLKS